MRSRKRVQDKIQATLTKKVYHLNQPYSTTVTPYSHWMKVERMNDYTSGKRPKDGYHVINPVSHTRIEAQQPYGSVYYSDTSDSSWTGEITWDGCTYIGNSEYDLWPSDIPGYDSWLQNCHFDFATSIDEMIRSKGLQLLDGLSGLYATIPAIKKLLPGQSFGQYLAAATLTANFAIAPMISDVEFLRKTAAALSNRLDWLLKHAGEKVVVRFAANSTFSPPPPSAPPLGTHSYLTRYGDVSAQFRAMAVVTYDMSLINPHHLMASMLARRLGIDRGQAIKQVWDALPFSFLLDYVVKIGDWLERMGDVYRDRLPVTVHSLAWSVKTDFGAQYEWWPRQDYNPGKRAVICNYRVKRYTRSAHLMLTQPQLATATPSLQQLALGAALARTLSGKFSGLGLINPFKFGMLRKWL